MKLKSLGAPTDMLKAVIPVAGLGTRMLPATKAIPKEMLPVVDKPLIQYIVDECVAAGIKEIILVTHSSKMRLKTTLTPRLNWKACWSHALSANCWKKFSLSVRKA
jgi:UDP-glucose pyrophosphorylase